jgi:hypothetical protein
MKEKTTKLGQCRDCDQGSLFFQTGPGFSLYVDDDGQEIFWYCLYCGSNHVDIKDEEGNVIYSEGDLYEQMHQKWTPETARMQKGGTYGT